MSHSSWTSVEYGPPSLVVYYKYKQLHCLDSKAKWGGWSIYYVTETLGTLQNV